MDQNELHFRKMPTKRLIQEIEILEKESEAAKRILSTRSKREETRWICGICKEIMHTDVDAIVKHIQRIHRYPQTDAIMNTEEIYL